MKKKKTYLIILIIALIILLIPIPLKLKDGGSVEYKAILYSITKYHSANPKSTKGFDDGWKIEILGVTIYNKINTYVSPNEENKLNEIMDYINNYLENAKQEEILNYAYSYVDLEHQKVVVGLIDNSKEQQDKFIFEVFTKCCGSIYIKDLQEKNYLEFALSVDKFDGKIISIKDDNITVEVINDSKSFKKSDKVTIKNIHVNDSYSIGNKVRVTFSGLVEMSNPAQISAKEITLIAK